MDKKEEFKNFISNHPEIIEYLKNKTMSMQDFYEIYDVYGDNSSVWDKYFKAEDNKIESITNIIKKINVDSIQEHVNSAQKVLDVLEELTKKTPEVHNIIDKPITKFFGD